MVGLFAAENAEAQYNVAKREQSWTFNPACLVLESTYWTIMQTFSTKAGKVLGNLGQVGHSSYAPGSGYLL